MWEVWQSRLKFFDIIKINQFNQVLNGGLYELILLIIPVEKLFRSHHIRAVNSHVMCRISKQRTTVVFRKSWHGVPPHNQILSNSNEANCLLLSAKKLDSFLLLTMQWWQAGNKEGLINDLYRKGQSICFSISFCFEKFFWKDSFQFHQQSLLPTLQKSIVFV